jgi:hypothetical protein
MSDTRTSITVYSDVMTLDEFHSLLGPDWMGDDVHERDTGLIEPGDPRLEGIPTEALPTKRYLYWQGDHGGWLDEEEKILELIELRSDITEVEWRQEDQAANYDDVISASYYTRDGRVSFTTSLIPTTTPTMIAAIRGARRQGNDHAAWLAVEQLLAGIERGAQI